MKVPATLARLAGTVALSCAFATLPQQASASIVLTGCAGGNFGNACSLGELVAGGGFVVNDMRFSGFTFDTIGSAVNTAAIRVDPIETLFSPGFTLIDTANTLRLTNDFTFNTLLFNVTALSSQHPIREATLAMGVGSLTGDNSFTHVSEELFDSSFVNTLGTRDTFCNDAISPGCANASLTDAGAVTPTVSALSVQALIDVVGDAAGVGQINSVTFQFGQVPEPASLALVAFGLAVVGVSSRRRGRRPQ